MKTVTLVAVGVLALAMAGRGIAIGQDCAALTYSFNYDGDPVTYDASISLGAWKVLGYFRNVRVLAFRVAVSGCPNTFPELVQAWTHPDSEAGDLKVHALPSSDFLVALSSSQYFALTKDGVTTNLQPGEVKIDAVDLTLPFLLTRVRIGDASFDIAPSGITPVSASSPQSDFYTLAPCRALDTRDAAFGGAVPANTTRVFAIAGACGVPFTARAISVNLTVTQPSELGYVTVYPAGTAFPLVSSLNYGAGQTRANNAVVALGLAGDIAVRFVLPYGTAHFILDVNGYFE